MLVWMSSPENAFTSYRMFAWEAGFCDKLKLFWSDRRFGSPTFDYETEFTSRFQEIESLKRSSTKETIPAGTVLEY